MNFIDFIAYIRHDFGRHVLVGTLFVLIALPAFVMMERRYQVTTEFLVVQNNIATQDFYTQFKSTEYLGKILSQALFTDRFIDEVIATGKINASFLPVDKKDRMTEWERTVSVKSNLELGMITVSVREDRERDASRILDGVTQVLVEKNTLFRSGDTNNVDIRILSGPMSERRPTLPELIAIAVSSFMSGALVSAFLSVMRQHRLKIQSESSFRR